MTDRAFRNASSNWRCASIIINININLLLSSLDTHRREMDDLREELRKLKEEKLDSKLKFLQNHRDNADHLLNGKIKEWFYNLF